MARTVYVKSARARLDKETGERKPLRTCEQCGKDIAVGASYKHISIKTGPTSSHTRYRCDDCPNWQVWEYSNSLSARIAEIEHNAHQAIADAEDKSDVESAMSDAADAIRELAEEKRDSSQSIEEGFGHPTTQSDELAGQADELDAWADEIGSADIPDDPDPEEADCETCNGSGQIIEPNPEDSTDPCPDCEGTGHPNEATDDQMDEWRTEVENACSVLDNCPV